MEKQVEQQLRRLQIRCRRPVQHLLAGEYHSVFKGRGIEFDELREYQYGDDVRCIDWRSVARTGKPYLRRYIEEREQVFLLAVDVSGSGFFGSGPRSKLDAARETAALLAWSAAYNNDRIGLLLFSDRVERFVPPARGRRHVLRLISELLEYEPVNRATNLVETLDFIGRVIRKRGIVFLFSDFLCSGFREPLAAMARRHDLTAVLVRDPAERRFPAGGLIWLEDAETGSRRLVDAGRGAALAPDNDLELWFMDHAIDHFSLAPQEDAVNVLSTYFHARHRRLKDESGG